MSDLFIELPELPEPLASRTLRLHLLLEPLQTPVEADARRVPGADPRKRTGAAYVARDGAFLRSKALIDMFFRRKQFQCVKKRTEEL